MSKKLFMNNYSESSVEIPVYLVDGQTFNSIINQLKQRTTEIITSIVFTKEPIPNEKIVEGMDVSERTSEYKAYGYVDGSTIYISPEVNNGVLYANESCFTMFKDQSLLTKIIFQNFNTEKTITMQGMFNNCTSLIDVDVSNFNTKNVEIMTGMFYLCSSLIDLDLSNFDTSNVINMQSMFYGCEKLVHLNLSNFNTKSLINTTTMFIRCTNLVSYLVIMNSNISDYNQMFWQASSSPTSKFIVKYIDEETKAMAEKLVRTKMSDANVFLWEGEDI